MKGSLVATLVVVLIVVAGGAYLLIHSTSTSSGTGTSQSTSFSSSSVAQIQGTPDVAVNNVACTSNQRTCVVSLVNSGGTVQATGCTLNGSPGVFAPKPSSIPSGGLVNVTCAPTSNSVSIPGFHVSGSIQLGDGSSVQFTGTWN
ncbi:MAG: hypothetical protein OK449_05195 [Thaumarchaeota archaeon]|nr:hypothetical protein [Nitrososphaerota archaeon]